MLIKEIRHYLLRKYIFFQFVHNKQNRGIVLKGSAAFSPYGEQIAYYAQSDSVPALVICRTDGTEKKVIIEKGLSW